MSTDPTGILFYGDPHGVWTPLIEAVRDYRPLAVVILGDCELAQPLPTELAAVWDMVPCWKWIIGNHDVQTVAEYEFLVDGHPDGDLGSKIVMLGDLRVAGLGGVYRSQVWYPKSGCDLEPAPAFRRREDMVRQTARADRFRGGVPRSSRATIFPEDHETLRSSQADILVCHEAPSSDPHGFRAIDELGRDMEVRLVVHGHHHRSYWGHTAYGIPVRGLGLAEPWFFSGIRAPNGQQTAAELDP